MRRILLFALCVSTALAGPVVSGGYNYNSAAEEQLNGFRPSVGLPCSHGQAHGRIVNNHQHVHAESSGEPIVHDSSSAVASAASAVTVNSHIVVGESAQQHPIPPPVRPIVAAEVHDHSQFYDQKQGYVEQALPLVGPVPPTSVLPLIPVNTQFQGSYHHEHAHGGNHHGAIINGIGKVPPPFGYHNQHSSGVSNQVNAHATQGASFGVGVGSPVFPPFPPRQSYGPALQAGNLQQTGHFSHSSGSGGHTFVPPPIPVPAPVPSPVGHFAHSSSSANAQQSAQSSFGSLHANIGSGLSQNSGLHTSIVSSGPNSYNQHSVSNSLSQNSGFAGHQGANIYNQHSASNLLSQNSGFTGHQGSNTFNQQSVTAIQSGFAGHAANAFNQHSVSNSQFSQNAHIDSALGSVIRDSIVNSNLDPAAEKHIYVHVPPEDYEQSEVRQHQQIQQVAPKKHYKIIFIKAPTQAQPNYAQLVANSGATEEKTIVYVLVKKPEEPSVADLQALQQTIKPSKPEVYFIKYKNRVEGAGQSQSQDTFNEYHSDNYKNNNEYPDLTSTGQFEGTDLDIDVRGAKDSTVEAFDSFANSVSSSSVTTSSSSEQIGASVYGPPAVKK